MAKIRVRWVGLRFIIQVTTLQPVVARWKGLKMNDLKALRQRVDKKIAALNVARSSCKNIGGNLDEADERFGDAKEAQELAQQVAQHVQQQAHDQIAKVVSQCLSAIFDEPYVFQIHFERKRGRTEARLTFERDGLEVDPLTASGGGVVDVASFALRLSCLILNKPSLRRFIVMDEPFRFLSVDYRPRVAELLKTLSEEMDAQFLMITHDEVLKIGKVVEL